MKVPWHPSPRGACSRGPPYLAEATPYSPSDVVTSVLDVVAFPNFECVISRAQLHTAKAPCLDLDAMITLLPRALSLHHDISNTFMTAQSLPRFGRINPPFSSFSAVLDPPLDALHHSTTQPPDRMQPTHPDLVLHRPTPRPP
jgi:hypothetical protein